MNLARISPGSRRKGRQPVDIVEKMSVPISNFAHIAAGDDNRYGLRVLRQGFSPFDPRLGTRNAQLVNIV